MLCGSQLPPDLLLEANAAKLKFQSSENVTTQTETQFGVESGTVFPGYEEFTNVETRHLPKNFDGVVINDDIPYKDYTLKTVILNSSVDISAELVFMDIEYQSSCSWDYLQIYVDEKVVIDRTCGYTIGRMLGVSDQETGRFGWAKKTTISENGNEYLIQDPTDVKMKGKIIVIVFKSDDIERGLGFGVKWSTRPVFDSYKLAVEWSFVELSADTLVPVAPLNTCLQTFSSAKKGLLDCSRTRNCNVTESSTSSFICAAEDFKCKYGYHSLPRVW